MTLTELNFSILENTEIEVWCDWECGRKAEYIAHFTKRGICKGCGKNHTLLCEYHKEEVLSTWYDFYVAMYCGRCGHTDYDLHFLGDCYTKIEKL